MDVWSALEREWAHVAGTRSAQRRLLAWASLAPRLAGIASPGEVVAAIGCMGDAERSSSLLSDLLVVADGDALAALAVVRSVLPGVRRAAWRRWRTGRDGGLWRCREEVDGDAVAAAWEAIDRHAGERHRWPARVIVRRVERSLRSGHDAHCAFFQRTEPLAADSAVAAVDEYGAWTSAEGTALLVVDAVHTGRLDPVPAALVFAVAVLGLNVSEAGRRLGLDRHTVYRSLGAAHRLLDQAARASPKGDDAAQRIHPRIRYLPKENFPMLPLLLTVKQAADLMGVGRTTLYELMDAGEVYSVHRGASRRVPLWAVYDYVDRLCDGKFRRVPLPAVVDLLVRLADDQVDAHELGADRHRALLESESHDRVDGGAVVAINAQGNASNGRQAGPPARPVA